MATPQFGMFGPLPWEVQAMQDQQFEQAAIQRAQLSPGAHNAVMSALGGRSLGQGIAGVFGGQDPAVARSKQLQAISKEVIDSGVDPSNFEAYYSKLGESLAKAGLMREAASVADALQSYKDKQAALDTKKFDAETARIRAEAFRSSKLAKSTIAQEIFKKNKEYSPASLQKYLDSITDDKPNGDLSTLEPYNENLGEWTPEGFTPDKRFVFTNKSGQAGVMGPDGKVQLYNGPVEKSTKGTNVSVGLPSVNIETTTTVPDPNGIGPQNTKAILGNREKALNELTTRAEIAVANKPVLDQMAQLVKDGNLITGSARDARVYLARFAATLGNEEMAAKVNDSDFFDSFATEMVLPLMKQLGGSDSNEELRTLTKATANRTMSPKQLLRHIKFLKDKYDTSLTKYRNYNEGLAKGRKSLMEFDPVEGRWLDANINEQAALPDKKEKVERKNTQNAPAAAKGNNAAIIAKYAKQWGVSEDEARRRLIEAKKGK